MADIITNSNEMNQVMSIQESSKLLFEKKYFLWHTLVACLNVYCIAHQYLGNTISKNTRAFYDLSPACLFKLASMLPQLSVGIYGIQS